VWSFIETLPQISATVVLKLSYYPKYLYRSCKNLILVFCYILSFCIVWLQSVNLYLFLFIWLSLPLCWVVRLFIGRDFKTVRDFDKRPFMFAPSQDGSCFTTLEFFAHYVITGIFNPYHSGRGFANQHEVLRTTLIWTLLHHLQKGKNCISSSKVKGHFHAWLS